MGGAQTRPTRGTVSVGGKSWRIGERIQKVDVGIFGRDELRNINTARAACRTIQRVRNVPRQPETLHIAHQSKLGVEKLGLQGCGTPCADVTAASFSRCQAAGERANLGTSRSIADTIARAEGPPDTRNAVMSYTQQTDGETFSVGKQSDCLPPESVLILDSPQYEVYEVDIDRVSHSIIESLPRIVEQ